MPSEIETNIIGEDKLLNDNVSLHKNFKALTRHFDFPDTKPPPNGEVYILTIYMFFCVGKTLDNFLNRL